MLASIVAFSCNNSICSVEFTASSFASFCVTFSTEDTSNSSSLELANTLKGSLTLGTIINKTTMNNKNLCFLFCFTIYSSTSTLFKLVTFINSILIHRIH